MPVEAKASDVRSRQKLRMRQTTWRAISGSFVLSLVVMYPSFTKAQTGTPQRESPTTNAQDAAETLRKLDQLVQQNKQLENQNRELMGQIESLRQVLTKQSGTEGREPEKQAQPSTPAGVTDYPEEKEDPEVVANLAAPAEEPKKWGTYTPNRGFKLVD